MCCAPPPPLPPTGWLQQLHTDARDALDENGKTSEPGVDTWEATNLLCVARVLVAAARLREETRGCPLGARTTPTATTPTGAATSSYG